MGEASVGQRAAALPWLCPASGSLLALADEYPDPAVLSADPAAVLLGLRYARTPPRPADLRLDSAFFSDSILAEAASRLLESTGPGTRLDPGPAVCQTLTRFARRAAVTAGRLARETRLCPDHAAAATALLAPTGLLLAAAVDPAAVANCLARQADGESPPDAQRRLLGLPGEGIVLRAAGRWRLPPWLTAVLTNLGLPAGIAHALGAPPGLFDVVQAAVAVCELGDGGICLIRPALADPTLVRRAQSDAALFPDEPPVSRVTDVPLLAKLLRTAARARRREAAVRLEFAYAEIDRLRDELSAGAERFEARVRDAKLTALAELAAGAGHEINNPLAIVSGNAQRLATRTDDPETRKALDSIIRQTRRISDIVSDLMQFARPKSPARRTFALGPWVEQLLADARPLAAVRGVELRSEVADPGATLFADPTQLGRAVTALLRNGIEAAGNEGWVTVSAGVRGRAVVVAVEDGGPGPGPAVIEHMFDPFYSGRPAGRGRGLGLPTAWRLARENGAEVRYDPTPGGPVRFVLEVPAYDQSSERLPERKSA